MRDKLALKNIYCIKEANRRLFCDLINAMNANNVRPSKIIVYGNKSSILYEGIQKRYAKLSNA